MNTTQHLLQGIVKHDRSALARAITLIESSSPKNRSAANTLMHDILPHAGNSIRLAITGVPGAGKSTFINILGLYLINKGHKVAVLAIDPTSSKSGGSILGDKTRMTELSQLDNAFIRPSPSLGTSGGVGGRTRETILLCEAAGFDIIIVETMGVGQGEIIVHSMVDFFLLLQIAGTGDDLQGMKKGIVELADAIVFNKADGTNKKATQQAVQQLKMALHYMSTAAASSIPVLSCSALENNGIDTVWGTIEDRLDDQKSSAAFEKKRMHQNREWMMSLVKNQLQELFFEDKEIRHKIKEFEKGIINGKILPAQAAQQIMDRINMRFKKI